MKESTEGFTEKNNVVMKKNKKGFQKMDEVPLQVIQQMVIQAVAQCTNTDLLDLVYKLISYDDSL